MGVKLQLLLGLLLISSTCGIEENTTSSQNASLEKVDSTKNLIEKLPKTETQINLVNKDTQDDADSVKYSEYISEKDTQQEKVNDQESNEDRKGRHDNSRSIDIEKFDTHDFQNNDYISSDNEKHLQNTIRKPSTKPFVDFTNFKFTTPKNFFDTQFEEAKQKLEQEFEDHSDDHHVDDGIDDDHDHHHNIRVDELFGESKTKPNSTLAYREKTKISKNNTISDGSEYNELKVETTHNINYDSVYKFTTSDEDDNEKVETTSQKQKLETTSSRGFTATTRKTMHLTKSPTSQSNHILSNKIESETIKAINLLTTEYSTTKKLKEENDVVPLEQIVEENKIIPSETVPSTAEPTLETKNAIELNTTTNQTTVNYLDFDNIPITEETTFTTEEEHTTTAINVDTTETKTEITTEQTGIIQDDNQSTTEQSNVSTTEAITTTESSTTESSTILTTIKDITEHTTVPESSTEYTTVPESTTEQITTEGVNRISKAFVFESTHTETTTTIIPETTQMTTETIHKRLINPTKSNRTTDENGTTTNIISKKEVETTTEITDIQKLLETSTTIPNTTTEFQTLPTTETTDKTNSSTVDFVHVTTKENATTLLPDTLSPNLSYPEPSITTIIIPVFRNVSVVTDDGRVRTTTEDSSESSHGTDAGNLGGPEENNGKIAAIIISTVGAVCLILLAGLLYIMRKRQKRFNYKQRCRPVGLDDYSVDNVSGYNSTRRKAERQSKRSYGNPAFEDPVAVTHPLNFPALAKFATNTDDIKAEFEEIPQITAKSNELPEGCETKNRYANVIPLPETRVFLQPIEGYPNSDYINANFVTGPKNTKGYYIACQGPMSNTVDDFWRMVWEQQTKVILMVTHLFENGVEKSVDYLPPSEVLDCNRLFGDFQITLKKRDVKDKYIISNLQLKNMVSNSWREVTHFWYLGWPEKGVPSEENSIIAFLIEARSYMKSATLDKNAAANGNTNGPSKTEINPVVVHCSPGTGRTGVVIACDIAIREFEQTRLVDIPKIVYRIRRDRASAVQTKEQYMFIYKVVSLYAAKLTGGALESF